MSLQAVRAGADGSRDDDVRQRLLHVIEGERRRAGVPGCAVLVVDNGRVLLNEGFGHRDIDADLPVTSQTLFPIGSATKTFTAAVLAGLAGDGRLDLDAPIREVLPDVGMHDPVADEALSIRDCLTHRSGLPRHDIIWQAGEGSLERRDLLTALKFLPASEPFRAAYQYNNLLYIAAGEAAAAVIGTSYEQAVTDLVLRPLGMTRTNFSVATTQDDPDHAAPYRLASEAAGPQRIPFASLQLAAAAGGINSCADDLIPWLSSLTGRAHPSWLLQPNVLEDMRTPAIAMPSDGPGPVDPIGYGLGLMLASYRGQRVAHHGGNIDGFSAQILTREDGVGIAVVCNLHATWLRDSLPYLILDALDDVPSPDHGTFFRDLLAAKFAAADAAHALPTHDDSHRPTSTSLADYCGRYRHPGYGDCAVALRDDGLTWDYRNLAPATLTHAQADVFTLELALNGTGVTLPARFELSDDGPAALLVQLEAAVPWIRFDHVAAGTEERG